MKKKLFSILLVSSLLTGCFKETNYVKALEIDNYKYVMTISNNNETIVVEGETKDGKDRVLVKIDEYTTIEEYYEKREEGYRYYFNRTLNSSTGTYDYYYLDSISSLHMNLLTVLGKDAFDSKGQITSIGVENIKRWAPVVFYSGLQYFFYEMSAVNNVKLQVDGSNLKSFSCLLSKGLEYVNVSIKYSNLNKVNDILLPISASPVED